MTYELTLAPTVDSVGVGRRLVREALSEWGLDDLAHTAMLLTSEVLTNSLLHARTQIVLTVSRSGSNGVTISVHDGSLIIPRRRRHAQDATTGRGLELLDRLAQSWRIDQGGGGKTLTFTLATDVDPWTPFANASLDGHMTTASPLGRYDDTSGDETPHDVHLLNLPVRVLIASRERHDELMREFALLALGGPSGRPDIPEQLHQLIETLGVRYGHAAARPDAIVDAALARGDDTIDLTYTVPGHVVAAADNLEALMRQADEFCRSGHLLTLARSELMVRFADWYIDQLRRQVAGQPPQPWDGPLEP